MSNCTIYIGADAIRGTLYRVINPEDLRWITVELSSQYLEYSDLDEADENGNFRVRVPTIFVEPDKDVDYVPFYYHIGDIRDASPFSIDMFNWYNSEQNQIEENQS